MIAIIDYGLGNIQSFVNIYKKLNTSVIVAKTPQQLESAEKLILPGVGSFDWAMDRLENSGLRNSLDRLVIDGKKPILGVCVGMQMMARKSDEGSRVGLSWIDADVRKFKYMDSNIAKPLPHMGWNNVSQIGCSVLFDKLDSGMRFYFLHSYFLSANNPKEIVGFTSYENRFVSAVQRDNIYGVQFHPEKSHRWGIQLLKNFAKA